MLTLFLLSAAAVTGSSVSSEPTYGIATAGDGDSLKIAETSFRLFGIDAPELDQSCSRDGKQWQCGAEAHRQLQALVARKEVRCIPVDEDRHGRLVARCITRDIDLNRAMVERGYAVAFRKYSYDYVAAEERAKAARAGLWAGTFQLPEEHRAQARKPAVLRGGASARRKSAAPVRRSVETSEAPPRAKASGRCVIKGNHSRRGEWIYHLPGMPYYEQTRPEQIFCTEAEARAAGYRRAVVR